MLYTGSGSLIPNDTMEQFKASDEDWRQIKIRAKNYSSAEVSRAVLELRDRVAALEKKARTAEECNDAICRRLDEIRRKEPAATEKSWVAAPAAAVPSDEELWELQLEAKKRVRPLTPWVLWSPRWDGHEALVAAHRALYNRGAGDGYQQGLAAGRAEQGSSQGILDDSTPEPEPSDFQTLHGIALDMVDSLRPIVIPEILNVLRRAIREPMAEQQAAAEPTHPQYFSSHHAIAGEIWGTLPDAPEPNQAPAEEAGLVEEVLDAMGEGTEVEARAAIRAVARWLRSVGNCGSAADLEWEANR
jgi:hypothetical protein